jgi:hypothetical protein
MVHHISSQNWCCFLGTVSIPGSQKFFSPSIWTLLCLSPIWTSFLASFNLGAVQEEIFQQNCELQTFFRETVEGWED